MSSLRGLADDWRARAARLQRYAPECANAFEDAAAELEAALADDLLTLTQAARECGYSSDHLGRLIRRGHLPNRGRPHAPRVARSDLPQKPTLAPRGESPTLDTLTRQVLTSKGRKAS
jgi:hypothetical protein